MCHELHMEHGVSVCLWSRPLTSCPIAPSPPPPSAQVNFTYTSDANRKLLVELKGVPPVVDAAVGNRFLPQAFPS